MIGFREAQQLLTAHAASFGKETIPLASAYGRVLATALFADRDYPPFNRSAMDGYAIRFEDFKNGLRRFSIAGTLYAGMEALIPVRSGQCCKIMTGAPVPEATDMVIRKEEVREEAGMIEVLAETGRPFQHISRQGEDLRKGDRITRLACTCDPPMMGLLASLGRSEVTVERLPRIALLTTGDEVVEVGVPVGPAQIRNSNRWLLQSLLRRQGITHPGHVHLPDDRNQLLDSVGRSLQEAQVLIVSGGVSAGDADHVPGVLEELGVSKLFHKLAIRPGKPAWCGKAPGEKMVFALPGNPLSCLVGYLLLVEPWIQACFALGRTEPIGLPLLHNRNKRTPLDEFFPVRLGGMPAGLSPVAFNGSGDIRLGLHANALALHPAAAGDLPAGTVLECYPFSDL
ncbi:MAG: molybdopterin molybdotransferase MoeA [Bacteroidota bacterium]|nr:molybdopterin molybdotransferase MoeA [Bacteroidota bacterium]MDP4245378.1 molybdopterin molybdotransferase MoeA [Bacteroidota bacterium]MDP4259489.1 molybdopterin molybdotransferase MoeA [Bacteroidota bacterium]